MKKVILVLVCFLALFNLGSAKAAEKNMGSLSIDKLISVNSNGSTDFELSKTTSKAYKYLTRQSYSYSIYKKSKKVGNLTVTKDSMNKGDTLTYINVSQTENVDLNIKLSSVSGQVYSVNKNESNLDINPNNSNRIANHINFIGNNLWSSSLYYSKDLGNTIIECNDAPENWAKTLNSMSINLYYRKGFSENIAFLETKGKLVNKNIIDIKPDIRILDIFQEGKIAPDGIYSKYTGGYIPWGNDCLWRNPSALTISSCANFIPHGDIFKDIVLSLSYAYISNYNSDGYIPTMPDCSWLYAETGIKGHFYDTRFNSDTAKALISVYKLYPDTAFSECLKKYITFFNKFAIKYSYKYEDGEAYFIPNYWCPKFVSEDKTVCALNHQLAELQILFEYCYYVHYDKLTMDVAGKMEKAIVDTADNWIKPDGNLWYSIDSNGVYGQKDYPTLTYVDLENFCDLLYKVTGDCPEELIKIKDSKYEWMKANNLA